MKKFFLAILIIWCFLQFIGLVFAPYAIGEETTQTSFLSQGDLINGWYWLRDPSFEQKAEWIITNIPEGNGDIVLQIEALATDNVDGQPGVDADFFLSYGNPPTANGDGLFLGRVKVKLPNIHDPNDSTGYICRGEITIPRTGLNGGKLWLMAKRKDDLGEFQPFSNHIAFHRESIQLVVDQEETQTEDETNQDLTPDSDERSQALPIESGTVTGHLGSIRSDGSRDNKDWYHLSVNSGQIITLTLTSPENANFSPSLYPPDSNFGVGSSTTQDQTKTLRYVAGESGTWSIRIACSSGEGDYQLNVNLQNGQSGGGTPGGSRGDEGTTGGSRGDDENGTDQDEDNGTEQEKELVTYGYKLTVKTGNVYHAGTDSPITITFTSWSGGYWQYYEYTIDNPAYFERGNTDIIYIPTTNVPPLGEIGEIGVINTNTGDAPGWYLEEIKIQEIPDMTIDNVSLRTHPELMTSENQNRINTVETVFPVHRWLAVDEWPNQLAITRAKLVYTVTVVTGDIEGAGTDASVIHLTLNGESDSTTTQLGNSVDNVPMFERGKTDVFELYLNNVQDVGSNIGSIHLDHNNSGDRPGWYVKELRVKHQATGRETVFPIHRWLATDEPPNQTSGDFYQKDYTISIETGGAEGAGTDADVFIQLTGERGTSDDISLDNPNVDDFERGQTNTFDLYEDRFGTTGYLGEINTVRLSLVDNGTANAGWNIWQVRVTNHVTGRERTFRFDQLLDPGQEAVRNQFTE
ncbi:MAG: PLAT/LH2 domain-containing protein [Candidatus Atribacteria bacterium]|nr:PLAT/LH2 domain-containing protein [Candidatus Atribacteria bacterium]